MKTTILHIKHLALLLTAMLGYAVHSQAQLKVGNNPTVINPDAILELQSSNKGLLLPRVALSSTTNPSPLTSFVNGMLVYDTVTTGDVTPGMYYCDGQKWVRLSATASSGNAWNLTGNSATDPSINFIGTTDGAPLLLKTNNTERVRITKNGKVGIGTSNPGASLHVRGDMIIGTLVTGNVETDSVLVVDQQTGLIKKASLANVGVKVLRSLETVAFGGQAIFNTPASITDVNKISLYRNGVQISFTPRSSNLITAEVPCDVGDEIRIVQLL
ncbi:MAG: hypothetical protein ACTHMM_19740 [Agriterribacter sp.]